MRIIVDFTPRIGFGDDASASNALMNQAYINQLVQNQRQAQTPLSQLYAGLQNAWPYGVRREPDPSDTHHTAALKAKIIDARYRILGERTT
jgi:hypothetical protein